MTEEWDLWWLVMRTPAPSVDVWPMGEDPGPDDIPGQELRQARITAARDLLGVPYEWMESPGYQVQYMPGPVHPNILAGATVHDDPPATG